MTCCIFLGILLTNGYWFNLQTRQWEQVRFPPYPEFEPFETRNLMMYSFRGKPTVFNMPSCDSDGECIYNDVVQYDSLYDRWESIGTMLHHRGFSTIVEVPGEYCEVARYETPSRRTAAIVVGGISNPEEPNQGDNVLNSVELIGCPRSISIPLEDFPERIYLTAGVHFVLDEEDFPLGKVVVCGGFTTSLENRCWEMDPSTGSTTWAETDYTLGGPRWAHEMVLAADTSSGSNKRVPMVLGGQNRNTEIWDPIAEEWKNYK